MPSTRTWFTAIFLLVNTLLAGYFIDVVPSANTISRALPVIAWYEDGTYAIDKRADETPDKAFVNGHYYSDKAPLSTWLTMAAYGPLRTLRLTGTATDQLVPVAVTGALLCGVLPFVSLVWLVFRRLVSATPQLNAVALAMLPLYGSFLFAYSGTLMAHVLAAALICGAYELIHHMRLPALAGGMVGLAVLAEFPTLLAVPIFFVWLYRRRRTSALWFAVGGMPCAAALLAYNYSTTGSALATPYAFEADAAFALMRSSYGLRWPRLGVMWELLFPSYRGLFFYAPALIVVVAAYAWLRARRSLVTDVLSPVGLFSTGSFLLLSSYFTWSGGWAYGPRHLAPAAALIFYVGLPLVATRPSLRRWAYGVSAIGVGMVWVSKATVLFLMPERYWNPVFELALPTFIAGHLRSDALPTQLFGVDPSTAAWLWVVLFVSGVFALHVRYDRTKTWVERRTGSIPDHLPPEIP